MKIHVLGSGASGGLPQWNCGGSYSTRARQGDPDVPPRSQVSVALTADSERWSIINASPDIRDQFARFPGLAPRSDTRDVPLDTVVITSADLDHTLGLLILRESLPYRIISTPWVRDTILEHNAAWRLLEPAWSVVKLDETFALDRGEALEAKLFPIPGKVPRYLSELAGRHASASTGVRVSDTRTRKRLVYATGVKSFDAGTLAELEAADLRLVDGTFFRSNELLAMRPGAADAQAMGHLPIGGADGSLATLAKLPGRSLYIDINTTNPIVDATSPEAASVRRGGVEIAFDGMEFEL